MDMPGQFRIAVDCLWGKGLVEHSSCQANLATMGHFVGGCWSFDGRKLSSIFPCNNAISPVYYTDKAKELKCIASNA